MFLQTVYVSDNKKLYLNALYFEQNHRAPGTYIDNNNTSII